MSRKYKSPDFYERYPALFLIYFPETKTDIIAQLSKAGFSYYRSVLNLDAIIDNKEFHLLFKVLELQEETILILARIYPSENLFWKQWKQRKTEYQEAIYLEKQLFKNFSIEKYLEVADKKSAFGKVAIDSLFFLSNSKNEKQYQNLLESHKYFSLGFQIYDDVTDFKEDFLNKQFNLAIHELSKKIDFEKYKDIDFLNKLFYTSGLGFSLLQKSIDAFEQAKIYIPDQKSDWYKTIIEMQNAAYVYHETTYAYIETLKKKNELKKIPQNRLFFNYSNIPNYEVKRGLDFIAKEFSQNYTELQHFMWLGKKEGFENENQLHFSDTFQRAMLNDCLLDISEKYALENHEFFNNENLYFLTKTNKDEIGVWSYFSTVKEIAADIDDLGQIMQIFIRTHQKKLVSEFCEKAINIAINERVRENGGIETWILPKENLVGVNKKQEEFNTTKWGKGPDVEVVANFLYALHLYDSEKYFPVIMKGINYILGEQKNDGYWESRWYYGNYYGTYVCLRLLNCFPNDYTIEKQNALKFILKSQNENGSFGAEEFIILSTAFSRLSLKYFPKTETVLQKSKNFLSENQQNDGSWRAENFIKPRANEPYKSKTLTTSFVLKSLL